MNLGLECGSAPGGGASPLPLESDLRSQLLAISSRTRTALGEEAGGLLPLQNRIVQHYFRLQQAERNLASRTQRLARPGSNAIRQIELERQRLGRELHTGVGQMLAAIRLQVEIVAAQLPNPPQPVQQTLNHIATLANDALQQVRSVSRRLHPPEWQGLTLEAAIQQLWDISGIPQKFESSLRIQPLPREPEQEIKVLAYRAAQEALSNLTRHSQAHRVEVSLEADAERLLLSVQDDGVGFDADRLFAAPASLASGIGLRAIREQADALGGRLHITSGPGGTRLELSAPFAAVAS